MRQLGPGQGWVPDLAKARDTGTSDDTAEQLSFDFEGSAASRPPPPRKDLALGGPSIERARIQDRFGLEGLIRATAHAMLRVVLGESRNRAEAAEILGVTIDEMENAKVEFDARVEPGRLCDEAAPRLDPRRVVLVGFGESEKEDLALHAGKSGCEPVFVDQPCRAAPVALRTGAGRALVNLDDARFALAAKGIVRLLPDRSLLLLTRGAKVSAHAQRAERVSLPTLRLVEHLGLSEVVVTFDGVDAGGRAFNAVRRLAHFCKDGRRWARDGDPGTDPPPGRLDLGLWPSYLGSSVKRRRRPRMRVLKPLFARIIQDALDQASGRTIREAAKLLGTSATRLVGWMFELGVAPRNTSRKRTPAAHR